MMFELLGLLIIAIGALLDLLNIWWGFESATKPYFKSGIILVPFVLYVLGSLLAYEYVSGVFTFFGFLGAAFVVHLSCNQLLPYLFDRLLSGSNGQT